MDQLKRNALRSAKNITKGYSYIQIKVRDCTSNDPWGPSGSQMSEIAAATYKPGDFHEIMGIIEKRLNDSGKNWRHVSKALTLLDYLVQCGSEKVTTFAQKNLYLIRTLKEFQYIDDEGADRGASIREKSKQLTELLTDDERLAEAKKSRQEIRNRTQAISGGNYGNHRTRNSFMAYDDGDRSNAHYHDEQTQLERAIEESKRTAEEHERRLKQAQEDEQLKRAIEASKVEYENEKSKSENNSNDLISLSFDDNAQNAGFDHFGAGSSAAGQQQYYYPPAQPADPFSMMNHQHSSMNMNPMQYNNIDPFHNSPAAGYIQPPQREQDQIGYAGAGNYHNNSSLDPPQYFTLPLNQGQIVRQPSQAASNDPFDTFGIRRGGGSADGSLSRQIQAPEDPFGSHYDQGSTQRNLVPRHLQNSNDANSQLANIVRNSSEIDPFASIANGRAPQSRPATGGMSSNYNYGTNASSQAPSGGYQLQQRPQYQPSDPFAMNSTTGYSYGGMSNPGFSSGAGGNTGAPNGSQKSAYYHASNQGALNQGRQVAPANDPFASLVSFPAAKQPATEPQPPMPNNRNTPLNSFPSSGRF